MNFIAILSIKHFKILQAVYFLKFSWSKSCKKKSLRKFKQYKIIEKINADLGNQILILTFFFTVEQITVYSQLTMEERFGVDNKMQYQYDMHLNNMEVNQNQIMFLVILIWQSPKEQCKYNCKEEVLLT